MGLAFFLGAAWLYMNQPMHADPLAGYRWKNRVILLTLPPGAADAELARELEGNRAALEERDLKIIDASPRPVGLAGTVRPAEDETRWLRAKYKLAESSPQFVLLGKDGGEKGRQQGRLDLAAWFGLIDTMPMRREEMRSKGHAGE